MKGRGFGPSPNFIILAIMANHQNKAFAAFFPETATASETLTTTTKEIIISARNTTLNVASAVAAVATVAPIPVGYVFKINAGALNSGSATLTLASGKTLIFDNDNEEVTLMSVKGDLVVVSGVAAIDSGTAGNVNTVTGTAVA